LLVHNVDSLQRNIGLIRADEAYTNSDILLFVETQAFEGPEVAVPGFALAAHSFLRTPLRGSGAACFLRSDMCSSITAQISESVTAGNGRISIAGVVLRGQAIIVGVYISPQCSMTGALDLLRQVLVEHSEAEVVIIAGDFNARFGHINDNSTAASASNIHRAQEVYEFMDRFELAHQLPTNIPTTMHGTTIDTILANIPFSSSGRYFCPSPSVHFPLWGQFALPL
ncbi:hypothetical protein H4R20_006706, partial [Coemansia guatemalensis]